MGIVNIVLTSVEDALTNAWKLQCAIFLLLQHGQFPDGTPISERVQTIAFPGLGTGVGRVGPMMCATQMRQAIDR
jgi:O-acetyl-ADP-ribose deacetylase (regulator of RNase III)